MLRKTERRLGPQLNCRAGRISSSSEYCADVARAHGLIGESKSAVLAHLTSGTKKGAKRDATESAADADR